MLTFLSLMVCFFGYCLFIGRVRGVAFAFTPAITTSIIMLGTFIGGICRALLPTAKIMYFFGIGFFLEECVRLFLGKAHLKWNRRHLLYICIWIIGVGILFLHFIDGHFFLTRYDNFSHWGIVARVMLKTDHIPFASDANVISFRSYPVGSAAFLYFCCNVLHMTGSNALLFAQAFAIFNFYFSLLGSIRTRDRVLFTIESLFCIITVMALTTFNISLDSLLVDNFVASIMLACFLLAFVHYGEIKEHFLELGLISGACVTVKTSGMLIMVLLFLVAWIAYDAYAARMRDYDGEMLRWKLQKRDDLPEKPKIDIIPYILLLGLPVLAFVIWKIHGYLTFSINGISGGKHSGSISYLASVTGSGMDRYKKAQMILPYFFSIGKNRAILPMMWVILLTLLKQYLDDASGSSMNENRNMVAFTYITVIFFFVYEISLLLMYLFSMSLSELSQSQSSYYRYNNTVVAVVSGICCYLTMRELDQIKRGTVFRWVFVCTGIIAIGYGMQFRINRLPDQTSNEKNFPDYSYMEDIMESNILTTDDSVLIRFQKEYNVPSNGANYYLYPCTDYTRTYDWESLQNAVAAKNYTVVIDLVNGTLQKNSEVIAIERMESGQNS